MIIRSVARLMADRLYEKRRSRLDKAQLVVSSCNTLDQLDVASKYCDNYLNMINDEVERSFTKILFDYYIDFEKLLIEN